MSIQEPSNVHDAKIQAATEVLRSNLQGCFEETSTDCNNRCKAFDGFDVDDNGFTGIDFSGWGEPEGHQVIRSSAEKWRKESLECITNGFWSLFKLTNELERDSMKSADAVEAQTWGIIYEFFQWTAKDKSNTEKFRKWQDRALGPGNNPPSSVMQMINDECNKPDLYISLHCDFRRLLEQRLDKLRDEAIAASPGMPAITDEEQGNVFACEGDTWRITFEGGTGTMFDSNGSGFWLSFFSRRENRFTLRNCTGSRRGNCLMRAQSWSQQTQ